MGFLSQQTLLNTSETSDTLKLHPRLDQRSRPVWGAASPWRRTELLPSGAFSVTQTHWEREAARLAPVRPPLGIPGMCGAEEKNSARIEVLTVRMAIWS